MESVQNWAILLETRTWSNTLTERCQVLDIQILTLHQLKYNFKYLNKKILVLEELL